MSNDVNTEHESVIGAYIAEIIAMRNRFILYLQKYELDNLLTPQEQKFINDISIACQYFNDSNQPKKASK